LWETLATTATLVTINYLGIARNRGGSKNVP
jgi:hypothetical protein